MFSFIKAIQSLLANLKKRKGLWFSILSAMSIAGIFLTLFLITNVTKTASAHVYEDVSHTYKKNLDTRVLDKQKEYKNIVLALKSNSYNEEGKFLPWVMRIAHNLIIDHFRKNKKMPLYRETEDFSIFSVMSDDSLTIENQLVASQVEMDLRRIINELPDDQKEVVMMRMYQDMSFKEISELTGVSINTALGRMRYALLNLRKVIDKHQIILTN